jgi:hypothetical protein
VNPYLLGLLQVLSLMLALVCSVAVLVMLRTRKPRFVPIVLCLTGWTVFAWSESRAEPDYDAREIARIDQLRAGFRPRLEQYRAAHGEYPSRLEDAGIPTPSTRYGALRYEASRDSAGNPRYWLAVGDYARNGFVSTWRSERGAWGLRMD